MKDQSLRNDQSFSDRLTHLVKTSGRSLWRAAIVCGLPLAGAIAGIASVLLIDTVEMSPWFRSTFASGGGSMMTGYAIVYGILFVVALGIGVATSFFILQDRYQSSYNLARSILTHTEVPALIAEGQVLHILSASSVPVAQINLPDTVEARSSAEEQIKLAAAYLQPLYAFAYNGDQKPTCGNTRLKGFLSPIRLLGYKLGSIGSSLVLGCPFNFGLSCILGPPVAILAHAHGLPYAEYLGNLKAISKHMLEELSA